MYYKSFTVKKYKGVENVSIDFSKNRIITLVGLNESGKTTILESMALFYRLARGETPSNTEINSFRPKGVDFTGSVQISAKVAIEESDKKAINAYWRNSLNKRKDLEVPDQYEYTIKFNFDTHAYIDEKRTCVFELVPKGNKARLVDTDNQSWQALVNLVRKEMVPEVLFYEDFVFDIPDEINFLLKPGDPAVVDADLNGPVNKAWQAVLNDILVTVNPKFESFQTHVADLWETDNSTALARITRMEGELNNKITAAWKELFKHGNMKLNFKEIRLKCTPSGPYLRASFRVITDDNKDFSINERSKGCKWFFSFLLFTEFRKNRSKNILFLLDEPASNLHTSAQGKILNAISELNDSSMVAYSTHSHHLMRTEWLSGAYVVINEIQSENFLEGNMTFDEGAKITAEKYFNYIGKGMGNVKVSYCQPILDLLDYAPSQMEPIPGIVITEGKNDWFTFKYINEVVGLKKKYDLNFYPGAGKDQLWEILRIYLSWGSPFVVILDGDKPGIAAQTAYNKEFGEFTQKKIFTLFDVLGEKWETEDMFTDTEKERIIDEAFGKGSYAATPATGMKSKFNFGVNQLLANNKQVLITKPTKLAFEKLFDHLESAL